MLLGEKINHYDYNTNKTVKEFNELFDLKLEYNEDSKVEILEPVIGGRRKLLIEGGEIIVSLFKQEHFYYKPYTQAKKKWGR